MITRRKKPCKKCTKPAYIFGRGLCRYCYQEQQYKKNTESITINTGKDKEFYMQLWQTREHICEVCKQIIHEPHTYNFHHLLPKAKYKEHRYNPDNIALLCWQCHDQYHLQPAKIPAGQTTSNKKTPYTTKCKG